MEIHVMMFLIVMIVITFAIIATLIYYRSAAFQQSITISLPFEETYRYVPNINRDRKYKIDTIKVTVTGRIKRDASFGSTITPGDKIRDLIQETIIDPYKNCLVVQDAHIFIPEESVLKRCPVTKTPTVENLSIMFFSKLEPLMNKIGAQLLSISLVSEDIKASNSRYKLSNYTM